MNKEEIEQILDLIEKAPDSRLLYVENHGQYQTLGFTTDDLKNLKGFVLQKLQQFIGQLKQLDQTKERKH